jgi:hypothetical protein
MNLEEEINKMESLLIKTEKINSSQEMFFNCNQNEQNFIKSIKLLKKEFKKLKVTVNKNNIEIYYENNNKELKEEKIDKIKLSLNHISNIKIEYKKNENKKIIGMHVNFKIPYMEKYYC